MTTQLNEQAGKLLIAVIEKHKCDAAMAAARKAGAPGGTVLMGRGTAQSKWLRILGLDDVEKELLYTLLPASLVRPVMNAIRNARRSPEQEAYSSPSTCSKPSGVTIPRPPRLPRLRRTPCLTTARNSPATNFSPSSSTTAAPIRSWTRPEAPAPRRHGHPRL